MSQRVYFTLIILGILSLCVGACNVKHKDLAADQKHTKTKNVPEITYDRNSSPITYRGDSVYTTVDDMPKFQGQDFKTFSEYINDNLQYPKICKDNGIAGTTYVQCIVDAEGKIPFARIVRGFDPLCDKEAMRLIKSSPIWEPGKIQGKNVCVLFTFPVHFVLD